MDRRLPGTAHLQPACPPPSRRPSRPVRRHPRQPDPRVRAVGGPRCPTRHHHPPPHHRRPAAGAGRRRQPSPPRLRTPLVRLHPHAEAGGTPAAVGAHRLRLLQAGDRRPSRRAAGPDPCRAHRRGHRPVVARPVGRRGARPDRHHLQRRCPAEGPCPPRRGARQTPYREPTGAPRGRRQAGRGRTRRARHRAVRTPGRRPVRQGHQRRRTRRPGAQRRGRLRPLAVRRVLAARRRGHGHRHPARRDHRRGDPRGRGSGRRDLSGRAARRRRGLGRRARPAARRPGTAGPARRRGPRPVLARFTWKQAAIGTAELYRQAIAARAVTTQLGGRR